VRARDVEVQGAGEGGGPTGKGGWGGGQGRVRGKWGGRWARSLREKRPKQKVCRGGHPGVEKRQIKNKRAVA